ASSEHRRAVRPQSDRDRSSQRRGRRLGRSQRDTVGRTQRDALIQDLCLQRLQRGAWLQAELCRECAANALVHVKRVGLATTSVERDQQPAGRVLTRGRLGQYAVELADNLGMPTQLELSINSTLDSSHSELVEAPDLSLCEVLKREFREWRAAPQRE